MPRTTTQVLGFLFVLMAGHAVNAAELTAQYLEGLWSLDGKEQCGSDNFEYVRFRADGYLETGDDGRAHGAGFWELKDQEVTFHLSTSPAFHREDLKGYGGVYDQFDIRVLTYNVENDEFGAIGLLADQVARATFSRCP